MKKTKTSTIAVRGTPVTVLSLKEGDYISLTDMLRAKDGDFFIADWLRNRNTVEFLGIWESVFNPDFNYGEFAIIRSQAGLNNYLTLFSSAKGCRNPSASPRLTPSLSHKCAPCLRPAT